MKKLLLCALLLVLFAYPALANVPMYVDSDDGRYVEGSVIVSVAIPSGSTIYIVAQEIATKFDLEISSIWENLDVIAFRSDTKSTVELIQELSSVPYVISVEPNYIYEPTPTPPAEKGSGGCNAGYGCFFLLLFANLLLATGRRK